MKLIRWFKKTFEYRGKPSARKVTVFTAFVQFNVGYIVHLCTGVAIQEIFLYILATIILLGLGFLTAENLVDIIKGRFGAGATFFGDYEQDIDINKRNRINNPDLMQDDPSKMGEG